MIQQMSKKALKEISQRKIRALRKRNKALQKRKAKKVLKYYGHGWENPTKVQIGRHADNLAICSCEMCGNPRKYWNEKTIQERRQDIVANEQLAEL